MAIIETTIEIDRPPAEVRAIVLDFARMDDWHRSFLKSIKPLPEGTPPMEMKKGDPMVLRFLRSPSITCKVYENTEEKLAWEGGPSLLFHGIHSIKFEGVDGGQRTKVTNSEKFTGIFGESVGLPGVRGNVTKLYRCYNRDLKRRCEEAG